MYRHLLVFTDDDRANLKKRYHALMQKLEVGKEVEKQLIDELTETMRVILQGQKDLQPLWEQVHKYPAKHYHLHLAHSEKEMLNLPWQLAIDTKQYPFIHISKGSAADIVLAEYKPQPGPLRILVMISSPDDLNYDKRLSYEEEEEIILKALSSLWVTGQVQVHFTEEGSLENLQQKLKLQHYHVLYFSGHGIYKNDTGYLLLEDAITLKSREVKAQQLARALKEDHSNPPPLIILSSCQTAQGSMEDGFRGVADELIHEGVPAVIAMAFSIKDQFNILFVGHLYGHLAHKHSLTAAYSNALQDMRMQEQQQLERSNQKQYRPSQWLIPQLYLSQQVDYIVDWQAQEQEVNSIDPRLVAGDYRFIGRRRECALLLNELFNVKPVLITGQGGIGKTALAEHLVRRLIIRDASFHCFAFNETAIGVGPMVSRLLHYLKTADPQYNNSYEADWENITHHLDYLIKRVTELSKPIWLFDNLESMQHHSGGPPAAEYDQWMNYVQSRLFFKYPVIFISRYEIPHPEQVFNIKLNQAPFVDFYQKYMELDLRDLNTNIDLPEPVDVADLLYKMFGGSYRTLEFLNEVYVDDPVKTRSLMQQISTLKDVQAPAKELMQKVHYKLQKFSRQMGVPELLTLLTNEELKTLHLLIKFDRPVLPLALEMQQDGKNFDADLQRLRHFTLIEEQIHKGTGRRLYYVAPLIKNSVEGIDLPQVYFYPERAGDYFYQAGDQITLSYEDLEAALRFFKDSGSVPKLNEVGIKLTHDYYRLGFLDETLHYGTMVEEIAGDETDGEILNNIGLTYLKYGNSSQALIYFTKFSIISRNLRDDKQLAVAFNAIGQTHFQLNDYDTAMDWLEKSLRLAKTSHDKHQEAVTLSNIGVAYCELGEYDKAMRAFQGSLRIRKKAGDLAGQAGVLNNICGIYSARGEHQKLKETLREALSVALGIDNKKLQGMLLNNIGNEFMDAEEYNDALDCFQKDLAVSKSIADEEEIGKALMGMGLVYKILGKFDEAIDYIARATLILEKFGYPDIQSETLVHMGEIYIRRGDAAGAIQFLQKALAKFRKGNKLEGEVHSLCYMGEAYLYLNDMDNAIKHLEECLSVLKKVDDKKTESSALTALARAYTMENDPDMALGFQEKNLAILQDVGDRAGEAAILYNMATSYLRKRLPELYLYYSLESYTIYSETNYLPGLYFMSVNLGRFLHTMYPEKYLKEALLFLEQAYEIGIQSREFSAVENVGEMIDWLQQQPDKKEKT